MGFLDEVASSFYDFDCLESSPNELESRISSKGKELESHVESSKRGPIVDDEDDYDDEDDDPPFDIDDYVLDYPPNPDQGSRRTYKISSSDVRINLGAPFGPTYIFVQGKDSACVVARKQEDPQELKRILISLADRRFDDIVRSTLDFQMCEKHGYLKQFAVVSVRLSPNEINQEMESNKVSPSIGMKEVINLLKEPLPARSHEQSAVRMLQSKLANEIFTSEETIETAISAMQCLCQAVFQDDEIEVYCGEAVWMKKLLAKDEIGEHLAAINNRVST